MKIYEKDCKTLHTGFQNSSDLISSLINGFVYAKLLNETKPSTYEFCIIVTSFHSITIPDLVFNLEENCKKALSKV